MALEEFDAGLVVAEDERQQGGDPEAGGRVQRMLQRFRPTPNPWAAVAT